MLKILSNEATRQKQIKWVHKQPLYHMTILLRGLLTKKGTFAIILGFCISIFPN